MDAGAIAKAVVGIIVLYLVVKTLFWIFSPLTRRRDERKARRSDEKAAAYAQDFARREREYEESMKRSKS